MNLGLTSPLQSIKFLNTDVTLESLFWMRCLSSTQDYGILYSAVSADVTSKDIKYIPLPTVHFTLKRPTNVDVTLDSYVDADFTNCFDNRISIPGFSFFLWEALLAGNRDHG